MENNLEQQLMGILSDPAAMEQIQSLARSLGISDASPESQGNSPASAKKQDPAMLHQLTALAGSRATDPNQQALLQALSPYLSQERVTKLENAMRAAKMAKLASAFLGNGGLQFLSGR